VEEPLRAVGHEVGHRRPPAVIGHRREHAPRLVQGQVHELAADIDPQPVHVHDVGPGIDAYALGVHRYAVDRDPSRGDQLLAGPTGADARAGEHLLQAFTGRGPIS
jgi:hypothetical protein